METRQQRGNKRKIVVSGTKRMEPAACRETLHSMAFGPQLGVGGRFLGGMGATCASYTIQHSVHTAPSRDLRGQPPLPTTSERSDEGGLRLTGIREASKSAVLNRERRCRVSPIRGEFSRYVQSD